MMFLHQTRRQKTGRGFTLIELAIVLAVVGVLAGGLWRMMSAGSQQTKDSATAQQQTALITAVSAYLADTGPNGGQTWLKGLGSNAWGNVPLPATNTSVVNCQSNYTGANTVFQDLCIYLPSGFYNGTANPYGQTYTIQALKDGTALGTAPQSYSFMIVASATTAANTIPDTDGGRISGLIGGDGGFLYTSPAVCGNPAPQACGALGAWSVANIKTTYGFTVAQATAGSVASRDFAATSSASLYWLARVPMASDPTYAYNTMTTDLFMGANSPTTQALAGVPSIHLGGSNNLIYGGTSTSMAQILMTASTTAGYSSAPIQLSTAGCSQLNVLAGCPTTNITYNGHSISTVVPAISVLTGDISVANGEVIALKIYSASDARLKMNIHPIEDPLASLMKLDAVAFAFKEGGSQSMGVTAQNLEKTYPQLVSQSNGVKYVEYNGLIGPLIGAVQELKRQNDSLREQMRQQTLREEKLERELSHKNTGP